MALTSPFFLLFFLISSPHRYLFPCSITDDTVTLLHLQQALLNASWSFDLSSLTTLTKALTGLDTLCTIFLWLEPKDLLEPVKGVLDRWESARDNSKKQGTMDESEGSSGFEKFGTLLGWVQGVVGRFGVRHLFSCFFFSLSTYLEFQIVMLRPVRWLWLSFCEVDVTFTYPSWLSHRIHDPLSLEPILCLSSCIPFKQSLQNSSLLDRGSLWLIWHFG